MDSPSKRTWPISRPVTRSLAQRDEITGESVDDKPQTGVEDTLHEVTVMMMVIMMMMIVMIMRMGETMKKIVVLVQAGST